MLSTREGIRKALVLASRTKPSQVVPRREVRMGSGSTQQEAGKQAGEKDGRLPDQNQRCQSPSIWSRRLRSSPMAGQANRDTTSVQSLLKQAL